MENIELNEQEQNRRDAVTKLRELGIESRSAFRSQYHLNRDKGEIRSGEVPLP